MKKANLIAGQVYQYTWAIIVVVFAVLSNAFAKLRQTTTYPLLREFDKISVHSNNFTIVDRCEGNLVDFFGIMLNMSVWDLTWALIILSMVLHKTEVIIITTWLYWVTLTCFDWNRTMPSSNDFWYNKHLDLDNVNEQKLSTLSEYYLVPDLFGFNAFSSPR